MDRERQPSSGSGYSVTAPAGSDSQHPAGRTKLPESVWQAAVELAREHGVYSGGASVAAGLYGAEETTRGSFRIADESAKPAFVELMAPPSATRRVFDRVRVFRRKQGAHPVESRRTARLDEPAARLAGRREMIQITRRCACWWRSSRSTEGRA